MALRILGTIPVTSCECERAVSSLRRLKTYLRSTMTENRLTGLAMMHIHYQRDIDLDDSRDHQTKMELYDVLED